MTAQVGQVAGAVDRLDSLIATFATEGSDAAGAADRRPVRRRRPLAGHAGHDRVAEVFHDSAVLARGVESRDLVRPNGHSRNGTL